MEDPRIISALFIFLKMAYYNVLINIMSAFVLQMSTTVLHSVSFRITLVYIRIASCQLSYYRCLQLYCILSAFVLHLVYICITSCLHLYYIMSAFVRQNPIFPSKLPLSVRNSPTGELARYA